MSKRQGTEEIDEKALLDSIYVRKNPHVINRMEPPGEKEPEDEPEATRVPSRRKRKEPEDYQSTYLKKRELKTRQCVYISLAVHEKIQKIVRSLGNQEISVGGYIDAVLWEHLETNKDEINGLYRKFKEQDDRIL